MRIMKKFLFTIALLFLLVIRSLADEGMWLPLLLGQQVYNDMVKKGLKLTKEQLYSINKASLKDAIIIFGRGCTGEIVSNEGLIFTNHHCGYETIASSSSIEHNYLRDGFYAASKHEEIPARGLYVDFLVKIDDVSKEVEDSAKGLSGAERAAKLRTILAAINTRYSDTFKIITGRASPLFKGNPFLVFVSQPYSHIPLLC